MEYPKWATPQRRALLVELFQRSTLVWLSPDSPVRGLCMDKQCSKISSDNPNPFCQECGRFFQKYIEPVIKFWIAEDKLEQAELWRREQLLLHHTPDRWGWQNQHFDPVAKDVFFQKQPPYYLESIGISGSTFTRIAKVRVPSTNVRLFVDVAKSKTSKNARHKAKRYGKNIGLLNEESRTVDQLCSAAVNDFKDSLSK
jgi:hypothetical protein